MNNLLTILVSLLLSSLLLLSSSTTTISALDFTFNGILHDQFTEREGWLTPSSKDNINIDQPNHFFLLCEKHSTNIKHHTIDIEKSRIKNHHNTQHFIVLHHDYRHTHFAKVAFIHEGNREKILNSENSGKCKLKLLSVEDKISSSVTMMEQHHQSSNAYFHLFLSFTSSSPHSEQIEKIKRELGCESNTTRQLFSCHYHHNDDSRKSPSSSITIHISSSFPSVFSLLKRFSSHPNVRRIEQAHHPDFLNHVASIITQSTHPINGMASKEFQNLKSSHNLHPVWRHNITGLGHLAAVADTGIDFDHCSFDDPSNGEVAFWPKVNPNHRKIYSYRQCVTKDHKLSYGDSFQAHGTHVAATVAGSEYRTPEQLKKQEQQSMKDYGENDDNTIDSTNQAFKYRGMSPDAKLFFFDLTCGSDQSLSIPHDPYDVFAPAEEAGAEIHSNSWGFPWSPQHYEAADRQTDKFAFDHPNFLIFFAAGNNPAQGILTPATAKNVLTVGAHLNSLDTNLRESMASFSAHGPTYDYRIKPELAGPGQEITSAASDGNLGSHNCGFVGKSGTSMATPVVSGSSILVRQYFEEGFYPDGRKPKSPEERSQKSVKLSSAALKAALVTASYPLQILKTQGQQVPNWNEGYGGLNLGELLRFDDDANKQPIPHLVLLDHQQIHHQSTNTKVDVDADPYKYFCISVPVKSVSDNNQFIRDFLRVTMVYHDPPIVAEGSRHAMLNDLDLFVINPISGYTYISLSAQMSANMHSNTEQVVLNKKPTDDDDSDGDIHQSIPESENVEGRFYFTIGVRGKHLATEYQNFSLVVMALGVKLETDGICSSNFLSSEKTKSKNSLQLKCPWNCGDNKVNNWGTSHGTCDPATAMCKCTSFYKGVFCEECRNDLLCHGNGWCRQDATNHSTVCDCFQDRVDLAKSWTKSLEEADISKRTYCGVCLSEKGYEGAGCAIKSSCDDVVDCYDHGTCLPKDQRVSSTRGHHETCKCINDDFDASTNCRFCAFDHSQNISSVPASSSSSAAEVCSTKTSWCLNRQTRLIKFSRLLEPQFIQINDGISYDNSMTCTWRFEIDRDNINTKDRDRDNFIFRLTFLRFDIEKRFDTVSVFDIGLEDENQKKKSNNNNDFSHFDVISSTSGVLPTDQPNLYASGSDRPPQKTTDSDIMVVEFASDFLGPGFGFIAKIEALRKCESSTCHGNGVCDPKTGDCTCNTQNFDQEKDCAVCKDWWYGSQCDEKDPNSPQYTTPPSTTEQQQQPPPSPPDDDKHHPATPSPNNQKQHKTKFAAECYTSQGVECSGNGVCDVSGTGRCKCNALYRGFLCDKKCPTHNGILCGGAQASCTYSQERDEAECICEKGMTGRSCQLREENVLEFDPIYSQAAAGVFVQRGVLANGKETQIMTPKAAESNPDAILETDIVKVKWPLASGGNRIYVSIHATPAITSVNDLPLSSPRATTQSTPEEDDEQNTNNDKDSSVNNKKDTSTNKKTSSSSSSPFLTKIWNDWSSIGILDSSSSSSSSSFGTEPREADDEFLSISSSPRCFVLNVFGFPSSSFSKNNDGFVEFGLTFFSPQHQKLDLVISMKASNIGPSLIPVLDLESDSDVIRRKTSSLKKSKLSSSSREQDFELLLQKLKSQQKKTSSSSFSSSSPHFITVSSTASCEEELLIPSPLSATSPHESVDSLPLSNIAVVISVGVVTFVLGAVLAAVAFFLWKHSIKKSRIRRSGIRLLPSFASSRSFFGRNGDGNNNNNADDEEETTGMMAVSQEVIVREELNVIGDRNYVNDDDADDVELVAK